jgi:simple sugar transport system substrate-binding protein
MKKICVPAVLAFFLLLSSCGGKAVEAVTGATLRKGPTARVLLARYMPEAMTDGIVKIAVLRNMDEGDHGRLFLEGCVTEGRSLGFTVDTFSPTGGARRSQELARQICAADYDGLILYYGGAVYEQIAPAVEKGLKAVAFDVPPFQEAGSGSGIPPGLTITSEDDEALARASLEDLLLRFADNGQDDEPAGRARPARVIRIWPGPGFPSQERRKAVFDEYVRAGKIIEAAVTGPADTALARNSTGDALTALLSGFPEGSVDAVWAPHDEFARGCADALTALDREDIKLFSIGISNDDIHLMLDNPSIWLSTAGADPRLAGVVNMRLLAAKLAGESVPGTCAFDAPVINAASLNRAVSMSNLAFMVPGWGRDEGLFDAYPWMAELKTAESRYLRLAPVALDDSGPAAVFRGARQ